MCYLLWYVFVFQREGHEDFQLMNGWLAGWLAKA
jgi:hypothetical protein